MSQSFRVFVDKHKQIDNTFDLGLPNPGANGQLNPLGAQNNAFQGLGGEIFCIQIISVLILLVLNHISYNKSHCIHFIGNGQNGASPFNPFGQNPPFGGQGT